MRGYVVGTLDTKGAELCYLRDRVADAGVETTLVDVSTTVQNAIYGLIVILWVSAFVYSLREYFKDREHESADYVASIAEAAVRDDDDRVASA